MKKQDLPMPLEPTSFGKFNFKCDLLKTLFFKLYVPFSQKLPELES